MSTTSTLLHPETQEILDWIANLIGKHWSTFEESSPESLLAARALAFVVGIKPATGEPESIALHPPAKQMRQTKMFDT